MNANKIFRLGTTSTEVIMACALMTAAMVTLAGFQSRITKSVSTLRQAVQARTEVRNARELVGSWQYEKVTEAAISEIELGPDGLATLPNARWIVNVVETEQPVSSKRVFLDLEWSRNDQVHTSSGISFWVTDMGSSL